MGLIGIFPESRFEFDHLGLPTAVICGHRFEADIHPGEGVDRQIINQLAGE